MDGRSIEFAGVVIALGSLCVVLLGALVGVVWRGGTLVAELKEAVKTLKEGLASVRAGLQALADIPILTIRMGNVEQVITKMQSDHKALAARVSDTRERMASLHDGDS